MYTTQKLGRVTTCNFFVNGVYFKTAKGLVSPAFMNINKGRRKIP